MSRAVWSHMVLVLIAPEMSSQQRVGLAPGSATPPHAGLQGTGDRAREKTEKPAEYPGSETQENHERDATQNDQRFTIESGRAGGDTRNTREGTGKGQVHAIRNIS